MAIDKSDIQGDVWPGLPKTFECFSFFKITDQNNFKQNLPGFIIHLVTTAQDVEGQRANIAKSKALVANNKLKHSTLPMAGVNISFTHNGLAKLEKTGLVDDAFNRGMRMDITTDDPSKFDPHFKDTSNIHGMFIITGDTASRIEEKKTEVTKAFNPATKQSIEMLFDLQGRVRPDRGKEHFGFEDGISQPQIEGLDATPPAKAPHLVPAANIFVKAPNRAKGGSFLAFRKLRQFVPEFHTFFKDTAGGITNPSITADKLEAQLMGRWKSGAPIMLAPDVDNPNLNKENGFNYTQNELICPFASHIRKSRPRADLDNNDTAPIIRRGIAYGEEVTSEETKQTTKDRGLIFVSYQSNVGTGFSFIQKSWANNDNFSQSRTGIDPIIGQAANSGDLTLSYPKRKPIVLTPDRWVVSNGGEYFFTPSISGLKTF